MALSESSHPGGESPSSGPGQANGDPVSELVCLYRVFDFSRSAHSFLKQSSGFYMFFFMWTSNCLPYNLRDWLWFCPMEQPQTPPFLYLNAAIISFLSIFFFRLKVPMDVWSREESCVAVWQGMVQVKAGRPLTDTEVVCLQSGPDTWVQLRP